MRLKGYDYSQAGCYFITICVHNRLTILSRITVGDAAFGVPLLELTEIGIHVKHYIENIMDVNPEIIVDNYVIMPNHIHLLVTIQEGSPRGATPTKDTIPKMINALKSLSTKKYGGTLWQRGYYDHIIRDAKDFETKHDYIDGNPFRWADDEYYHNPATP